MTFGTNIQDSNKGSHQTFANNFLKS